MFSVHLSKYLGKSNYLMQDSLSLVDTGYPPNIWIQYIIYPGFTGGFIIAAGTKELFGNHLLATEEFNPALNQSCPAGDITRTRKFASFCNNLLCGGNDPTYGSCEKFDGVSTFEATSVSLVERRQNHLCWGLPSGEVLLLGGEHAGNKTELVSADGRSSSANFDLPYDTM